MRIHTNKLWHHDLLNIAERVEGITFSSTPEVFNSCSHDRAYEIRLTGSSKYAPRNLPGHKAATYEQWGKFIARIFAYEPDAKVGYYKNAEHFHDVTKDEFRLSYSLMLEIEQGMVNG